MMKPPILIVEDHDHTRLALATHLEYAGYAVTQAPDGETALALLEEQTFWVVLTDIVMGAVDGITVLERARLQPYHPEVIILTGYAMLETSIAAVRAGAYDYLVKPCDDEELLQCIAGATQRYTHQQRRSLAERYLLEAASLMSNPTEQPDKTLERAPTPSPATPPETIQIGQLTIGPTRFAVALAGQSVHTTPTEYALLRYLAETPGTVRHYRDIVQITHHLDTDNSDAQSLLRTHIRNLRQKLAPAYIVTEHGVGCKLVDPDS
jgi:two-component system, OmpR family, response regulator